jgi:hypothetical protein
MEEKQKKKRQKRKSDELKCKDNYDRINENKKMKVTLLDVNLLSKNCKTRFGGWS